MQTFEELIDGLSGIVQKRKQLQLENRKEIREYQEAIKERERENVKYDELIQMTNEKIVIFEVLQEIFAEFKAMVRSAPLGELIDDYVFDSAVAKLSEKILAGGLEMVMKMTPQAILNVIAINSRLIERVHKKLKERGVTFQVLET